jgi:hypothetical protein
VFTRVVATILVADMPLDEWVDHFQAAGGIYDEKFFQRAVRTATLATLQQHTAAAYGDARRLTYALGYHQAIHLAMHCGQIRTIRNLYCKTRGEPARFDPENPTYPH